jgi:hypothetical protein
MTSKSKRSASKFTTVIRTTIFGPPPILEGEDASAYDELLVQVSNGVKPKDIIEEIWIRDIVDLTWEIFRYRRLKARWLSDGISGLLGDLLYQCIPGWSEKRAHNLALEWEAREAAAIAQVEEVLASCNLTMDTVYSPALVRYLDEIERIDRLTAIAEGRRNAVFREIDRHRATLAQALRGKVHEIEDAEFETIGPQAAAPKSVSDRSAA